MSDQFEPDYPAVVTNAIIALGNGDIDAAIAECTEGLVFELPFAPDGMANYHAGKADVRDRFMNALGPNGRFSRFEFRNVRASRLAGEARVVAEYESHAITKTGSVYDNRYIGFFDFDGQRIARWQEFFNPLRLVFPASESAGK